MEPPDTKHASFTSTALIEDAEALPTGCVREKQVTVGEQIESNDPAHIWVEFPPRSRDDPFYFSRTRKWTIMVIINFFAFITCFEMSAFSISIGSMLRDIGGTPLQAAVGLSLYGWGFAVGPLVLAPITEEFGRYRVMIYSNVLYLLLHLMMTLGTNMGTVLANRFLLGLAGCIGPSLTPGFISDIYPPEERTFPMALFTLVLIASPGFGALCMGWVEANPQLEWRWVHWIQLIIMAVYVPLAAIGLPETRTHIILEKRAKKLRKERGLRDGGRYTARSELHRQSIWAGLKASSTRPILFLTMEPLVTFFALWTGLVWGVYFIVLAGLPYVFKNTHHWEIQYVGITYVSISVGSVIGFLGNFVQEAVYRWRFAKDGVEARLWGCMVAAVVFAAGCFLFGATSLPSSHWTGPCLGVALLLASAYTILQCCLIYLSNSYGTFASSAVAGMSFARILIGSGFAAFTSDMFDRLTARWAMFLMGGISVLFIPIPIVAYWKGPWIREHSPYSKKLIEQERLRIAASE